MPDASPRVLVPAVVLAAALGFGRDVRTYSVSGEFEFTKIVDKSDSCVDLEAEDPTGIINFRIHNECYQKIVIHPENCEPASCLTEPMRVEHGAFGQYADELDLGIETDELDDHDEFRIELHVDEEARGTDMGSFVIHGIWHEEPDRSASAC